MRTCSRELNANRYRFAAAATLVALLVPTVTAGPPNIEITDECGSEPVMVESVEPWRAADCAGLITGDRLVGWQSGDGLSAGSFESPWDVELVEREHGLAREVVLTVCREGASRELVLAPRPWGLITRPADKALDICSGTVTPLGVFTPGEGIPDQQCLELATALEADDDGATAAWLWRRLARISETAGDVESADRFFTEAARVAHDTGIGDSGALIDETWADALHARNQLEDAQRRFEDAIAHWRRTRPHSLTMASALTRLTRVHFDRGHSADATTIVEQALSMARSLAPGSLVVAEALKGRALAAYRTINRPWAADLYRESNTIIARVAAGTIEHACSMTDAGIGAHLLRQLDEAERSYLQGLALLDAIAPGHQSAFIPLKNLGMISHNRSDYAVAEGYCRAALHIAVQEMPGSMLEASAARNLGIIRVKRGDPLEATALFERSLAIREKLAPDSDRIAGALYNIGRMRRLQGDLLGAEENFRRGLDIARRRDLSTWGSEQSAVKELGVLALIRGELELAASYGREQLAILEKNEPGSPRIPMALSDLAVVEARLGAYTPAWELISKSIETLKSTQPDHPNIPQVLDVAADIAVELGNLDTAWELSSEAINHQRTAAAHYSWLPGYLETGVKIALARDDIESATRLADELLELVATIPESMRHPFAPYAVAAKVAWATGRRQEALELSRQAADLADAARHDLSITSVRSLGSTASTQWVYDDLIDRLLALDYPEEAFHTFERSRARALITLRSARDLEVPAEVPVELDRRRRALQAEIDRVQTEFEEFADDTEPEQRQGVIDRLLQLRDEQNAMYDELRASAPRLAPPEPALDLERVRAALDPGTLYIAFLVRSEETLLFVVAPAVGSTPGLTVERLPVGTHELERMVLSFREIITTAQPDSLPDLISGGATIHDLLLGRIESHIDRAQRLLISADGPLHYLPFGALVRRRDDGGRPFLAEWKPHAMVASASAHAQLAGRRRPRAEISVVAFGDPAVRAPGDTDSGAGDAELEHFLSVAGPHGRLPATREEVGAVRRVWGNRATSFLGADATEERFKALGLEADIIHLACHGRTDPRIPLSSGLLMAAPGSQSHENGLLQAWEILGRLRLDADLVVLSACETALGAEARGEGLLGLVTAFQTAGSRAVVASLWQVPDRSTAELMHRFHDGLHSGMHTDQALRAAQLALLREPVSTPSGETIDGTHPRAWAGFQVYGDWW